MDTAHTTNPQVRAGCYCRISSDPDDKREGVDRQREDTTALCEVKGWTPAGFYIDNDRSASNGKQRPEWERLLADIEAGKIDAIAAWDQDRNWRMMHELEDLRRFFTGLDRKIKLATTGQGEIDLYSPAGVLTAQIKTAVTEHEISMMKIRMRRAHRQRADKGLPHWQNAFGYLAGPDGPQLDPFAAPLIRQAYAQIVAGGSLSDVAAMWNEAGAVTPTGRPWRLALVSPFMRNPRNAGLREYNGEIVGEAAWPAVVEEATWRAAQQVLDARTTPARKSVRKRLLTGVLLCGKCGHHLSGMQAAHGRAVYSCKRCRGVSIRVEQVEPLIHRIVAGRLAMPDAVDLLKAEIHDQAQAEAARLELNRLYGELDSIGRERGEGDLTGPQAKIATAIVNDKIAAVQRRQQDAERLRVFADLPLGTPKVAAAIARLSPDRFRAVLHVLATVVVAPAGKGCGRVFDPERVQVSWR